MVFVIARRYDEAISLRLIAYRLLRCARNDTKTGNPIVNVIARRHDEAILRLIVIITRRLLRSACLPQAGSQ